MTNRSLPNEIIQYILALASEMNKQDLFNDIRQAGRRRELKQEVLKELCEAIRAHMGLNVADFEYPNHAPIL